MNGSTNVHDVARIRGYCVCLEAGSMTLELRDSHHDSFLVSLFGQAADAAGIREVIDQLETACEELRTHLDAAEREKNAPPAVGGEQQGENS